MSETLRMTPGEERDLRAAFDRDRWAGEWNSLPTAIDRLLESRALLAATAPTPDEVGQVEGHVHPDCRACHQVDAMVNGEPFDAVALDAKHEVLHRARTEATR